MEDGGGNSGHSHFLLGQAYDLKRSTLKEIVTEEETKTLKLKVLLKFQSKYCQRQFNTRSSENLLLCVEHATKPVAGCVEKVGGFSDKINLFAYIFQ